MFGWLIEFIIEISVSSNFFKIGLEFILDLAITLTA